MPTTPNVGLRYPAGVSAADVVTDITNLATDADLVFAALTNSVEFRTSAATLATSSTSFVDITGGSTSFTKLLSGALSNIVVEISISAFSTAIATLTQVGVNINGADVLAVNHTISAASAHSAFPTGVATFTGLAAGTYTVKARAKWVSGGTFSMGSENSLYMRIWEKFL